jgi:hypothetical protein
MSIRICGDNTVASPAITSASDTDTGLQFGTNEVKVVNGNLDITDGDLIVAAGHGIDFSADANAAGMTSELLDDYEEGTFEINNQTGIAWNNDFRTWHYTKIGRLVYVNGLAQAGTITSNTDYVVINLPFTSAPSPSNSTNSHSSSPMVGNVNDGDTGLRAYLSPNSSVLAFYRTANNAAWDRLRVSDLADNDEIYLSFTYITAI